MSFRPTYVRIETILSSIYRGHSWVIKLALFECMACVTVPLYQNSLYLNANQFESNQVNVQSISSEFCCRGPIPFSFPVRSPHLSSLRSAQQSPARPTTQRQLAIVVFPAPDRLSCMRGRQGTRACIQRAAPSQLLLAALQEPLEAAAALSNPPAPPSG